MSATQLTAPWCARFALARPVSTSRGAQARSGLQPHRPSDRRALACCSGTGTSGSHGSSGDAGSLFVQQFKTLSASEPAAAQSATSDKGCCGSKSQSEHASSKANTGGCGCSGSGGGTSAATSAATAVAGQLNSLMSGMDGTLSREDIRSAFEANKSMSSMDAGDGGERFLDVVAILSGRGEGNDELDSELDALVV